MIFSHPNKLLEKHIHGVLSKYRKNCHSSIGEMAILFHDLGKLNPNFQSKIQGEKVIGYSNHSYLSVIFFYNFLLKNEGLVKKLLAVNSKNEFRVAIWQILSTIAHHHGNLPNLSGILNEVETQNAGNFIATVKMGVSNFIKENLKLEHQEFLPIYDDKQIKSISRFDKLIHGSIWQENALKNYLDTQFCFASLIEADKRDAGDNETYFFALQKTTAADNLQERLSKLFEELDHHPNHSDLDIHRTAIRVDAIMNVKEAIKLGHRVFSLPAPTGSGKTYTLLAIANEIMSFDNALGIIYSLPFLSITDQVEAILKKLNIECLTVSSKSQNDKLDEAQTEYESNPTQENLENLLKQNFSENTFDHPFVLTTFVQFFETLVSNKNSTLLKLPNFSNRVFLIDEIQALPPRLYIFFTALLDAFCKRHNSYAVISTGTMPKFGLPDKNYYENQIKNPSTVFKNYREENICEVIQPEKYFSLSVFNRYKIDWLGEETINFDELINHISEQEKSCLIVLNTIADTKFLFDKLKSKFDKVILLNTHFVVEDRINKIEWVKKLLKNKEQVIVVSTQLIEAGVDVDFPIVYRDLCPLPSLIQSAGRCNRNKNEEFGQVYLFQLINEEGKKSSDLIYRKEAKQFLKFCKSEIKSNTYEKDLFEIQSRFFEKIKQELSIGEFVYDADRYGNEYTYNFIECINNASFEDAGKFKLILENKFGETYQYFIPKDENDKRYDEFVGIMMESLSVKSIQEKKILKIKIETALKSISNRLLTVRIKQKETEPAFSNPEEYYGIRVLSELSKYSEEYGIELGTENCFL